jgi:hypothetical protein
MARIYYYPNYLDRISPEIRARIEGELPDTIRQELKGKVDDSRQQVLVPFLGAGASLSGETAPVPFTVRNLPSAQDIEGICSTIGVTRHASKLLVAVALQLAQLMDSLIERSAQGASHTSKDGEAPSSWELANFLTQILQEETSSYGYVYEPFERYADQLVRLLPRDATKDDHQRKVEYLELVRKVAELLNLHRSIPELLTIASYFGPFQRDTLRRELRKKFETVTSATKIQKRLVETARAFVSEHNKSSGIDKSDYLLITTNFDCLMEQQLDGAVPTCVITVLRDQKVAVDFGKHTQDHLELDKDAYAEFCSKYREPAKSVLCKDFKPAKKNYSLAMVFKLHGCPRMDRDTGDDNIVIADRDYVRFIQESGTKADLIPSCVRTRVRQSRLLFLGYSFSDWNVRDLYEQFLKDRVTTVQTSRLRDYIVTRSYAKTDDLFFKKWTDLSVFVTDLDSFAESLR